MKINFHVHTKVIPSFNIEVEDDVSILTLKSLIWSKIREQYEYEDKSLMPCLSIYPNEDEPFIDEERVLSDYFLHNGGIIYLHLIDSF